MLLAIVGNIGKDSYKRVFSIELKSSNLGYLLLVAI